MVKELLCDSCKHRCYFEGKWVSNKKGVPLGIEIFPGCKGKELSATQLKKINKDGCKTYVLDKRSK